MRKPFFRRCGKSQPSAGPTSSITLYDPFRSQLHYQERGGDVVINVGFVKDRLADKSLSHQLTKVRRRLGL